MTLLFSEGFYPYAAQADFVNFGYTANALTYSATSGYNSQPGIAFTANGNFTSNSLSGIGFVAPASNEIRFGFWLKCPSGAVTDPGSGVTYGGLTLQNSGATYNLDVRLGPTTGRIGISNFSPVATLVIGSAYTGLTNLRDGQHHWIEVRAIIAAASGGTLQVWVDGTQEINQTGITNDGGSGLTATSLTKLFLANWTVSGGNAVISHVMIWDTSGSGMIGYTGPSRIETLTPNAAGDLSGLTPTSGANYTTVNETVPNFDTNYVESAIATTIDLYNYTTLSVTPASIKGVMVKTFAKNADVGSKTFRAKASSSAVIANGATQTLAVSYKQFTEFFPVDPNTSAAWTKAGIDAAQFGVEVQT